MTAQQLIEREFFRWLVWLSSCGDNRHAQAETLVARSDVEDFESQDNRKALKVCKELVDAGEFPSMLRLLEPDMADRLKLDVVKDLFGSLPGDAAGTRMPPFTPEHALKWLKDRAADRQKSDAFAEAQKLSSQGRHVEAALAAEEATKDPFAGDAGDETYSSLIGIAMTEADRLRNRDKNVTVMTGMRELDEVIGGMDPGAMMIVGARPGAGKTSMGLALVRNVAAQGLGAGFVSCEDPKNVISVRVAARESGMSQDVFRHGAKLKGVGRLNAPGLMEITDRCVVAFDVGGALDNVLASMDRLVRAHKCNFLVVDYVQAIRGPKAQDRRNEIRASAQAVKAKAARLGVPVVLMSQLKRVEADKMPTNQDLRDAGELEEMAEWVILLWRRRKKEGFVSVDNRFAVLGKNKTGVDGQVFPVEWDDVTGSFEGLRSPGGQA